MAEKSLFFNALPDQSSVTGYDRNYNADDISDWLSVVFETGVIKDGLKVEVASGLNVNVNVGRAAIKGKGYINNSIKTFTVETNGTANTRYDYIKLKFDNNNSVRDIKLELVKGSSTMPTVNSLTRNTNVYELMLAIITVGSNATSVTVSDKRGNASLCPWFTAVKGYDDYYDAIIQKYESVVTMASVGTQVITTLPSNLYNNKYSLIEVYTNGIKEATNAYTVATSGGYVVITFTASKSASTKIQVVLNNFIDGEGMSTAIAGYNTWVADVAKLKTANEYNYICNGTNDNVLISNLVKTFLNGTGYGSMKLNVIGNFGYTAMARGDGSNSNPYGLFDFNVASTNRKAIIDFSSCSNIPLNATSSKTTYIFYGNEMHIIGANVIASQTAASTIIRGFNASSGEIRAENCRFWLTGYQDSLIAMTGTFINCRASVTNQTNNSYCFLTSTSGLVRIEGGEYYAYTADSNVKSAIVGQSGTNAVSILYGVNAPTVARNGYYQTNAIYQISGGGYVNCTDLISALTVTAISGSSNIRGTIPYSKPNAM